MILLNEPNIKNNSKKYIQNCLDTNWVSTSGLYIKKFERKIKKITNSKYVTLTNSGTSALHLALMVAGVKKNTEVICPSMSFISPINAIIYCGASPIFFDCDENYNLNIKDVLSFLQTKTEFKNNKTYNLKTSKVITAVIVVHMWGNVCDFSNIKKFCRQRNIKIIEDASESLGSYFVKQNKKIHTGVLGDFGCLSFNGNKIITTGSGGAVLTSSRSYKKKIDYFSAQAKDDSVRFKHNDIGYNYRMANLNAALGLSQIKHLKNFVQKKRKIRLYYERGFKHKKGITMLQYPKQHENNFWLNILLISKTIKKTPYQIHQYLLKHKIETRMIWYPCHLQVKMRKFQKFKMNSTRSYYNRSLCLPSGTSLSKAKIDKVIDCICKI
ncbi:aminotransferase class I/II-fold pyridoxal phosphate-dependent enzyme [Candidatus Pelagibacter sp.]|nr:aminotransferase class I/II-fold pyridoxal phosphate-dependent enzyme [Candidatus Pelagibacter sp.]